MGLHKNMIFSCPEWAAISAPARSLYLLMKGKRNPKKYGDEVKLSYRNILKLKYRGLRRKDTIARSFKELEEGGWIKKKNEVAAGGLYGKAAIYILTGKYDRYGF